MNPSIDNYTTSKVNTRTTHTTNVSTVKNFWTRASTIFYSDDLESPAINDREIQLLEEYTKLKDNWDGEGAKAIERSEIVKAEYIVKALQAFGQKVFHVAPGPNGEILVDIRNKSNSIELLFYPQKSKYVLFTENAKPDQGVFEFAMLPELLKRLNA